MSESNYRYQIALSYAHADEKIALLISKELRDIFADKYFRDEEKKFELTSADNFKQKLQEIFRQTRYPVILYSDNYQKAEFTQVELEEIVRNSEERKDGAYFILNMTDKVIENHDLIGLTYLDNLSDDKIHKNISDIKEKLMHKTFEKTRHEKEYSINIHTLFEYGNTAIWREDYDWNLFSTPYIKSNGRDIDQGHTWKELWEYIRKDFLLIISLLKEKPDTLFKIHMNCHLSIAYKLGQLYGDLDHASNRKLVLDNSNNRMQLAFSFGEKSEEPRSWDILTEYGGNDGESEDIVCIINVRGNFHGELIVEKVKNSLDKLNVTYNRLYLFEKEGNIKTAGEMESLVDYLDQSMRKCRKDKKGCTIHLFLATLAPVAFLLGGKSVFPGEVKLYEYKSSDEEYEMALTRKMDLNW